MKAIRFFSWAFSLFELLVVLLYAQAALGQEHQRGRSGEVERRRIQTQRTPDGDAGLKQNRRSTDAVHETRSSEEVQKRNSRQGGADAASHELEKTPTTNPENFEPVRGTKGKKDKGSGEIWEKDTFHKNHFEVYANKRNYENGKRDRDVWDDGRPKRKF